MCAYECIGFGAWHNGQLELSATNYQAAVELAELKFGADDPATKKLASITETVMNVCDFPYITIIG